MAKSKSPIKQRSQKPKQSSPRPGQRVKPGRRSAAASALKSSARSTVSGPALGIEPEALGDAATAKLAGTARLAAAFPYNAAKASEFTGEAEQGQSVEPPHPADPAAAP